MIKVSRFLKENAIKIMRASEQLKKKLGREPTLEELSEETEIEREEIVQSMEAVREPVSLSEPVFEENGKTTVLDTLVKDEDGELIDRLLVKELLGKLDARERQIILLRFFGDKTQSEIAQIIGVSQVQVSRLLQKTLDKLKDAAQ